MILQHSLRLNLALVTGLFISLFGGAAGLATPLRQTPGITYPIVKRDSLLNGLQVLTLEKVGTGTVTLHFRVNSGALFDLSNKGGLADITAGMLLKGGGGLSAKNVEETVEQSGIRIGITVSWDSTDLEINGPAEALETMFDLLGRLVTSPNFDAKELEALIADRSLALSGETSDGWESLNQKAAEIVYGNFPFARTLRGNADSLKKIGRDDLLYYYRKFYLANNSLLFATGDLTAEGVTKLARTKLGSLKKGEKVAPMFRPPEPLTARRVVILDQKDRPTLQGVIMQNGVSRRARDYFAALVMSEVLKAGLARQAHQELVLSFEPRIVEGPLTIRVKAIAGNFLNSLNVVLNTMKDMQAEAPASDQVEAAKALIISRYAEELKQDPAQVFFDVELYGLGRDYLITYADRVNAITAVEVQQAAKKYLKPQSAAIIVQGDAKAIEADLKKLGTVTTMP